MEEHRKKANISTVFLIYLSWVIIGELIPYLNRIFDFQRINVWILPAVRMTLMFSVTYMYVKLYEKQSFSSGFTFSFKNIGKNIFWAVVFFVVAGAVLMGYQFLIVKPLTEKFIQASSGISEESVRSFGDRLIEFLYIFYEEVIEVFLFIGFLLDRLAKYWNWPLAIIVSNIGFALWHYDYWSQGWLEGSLMILLTFISGIIVSLSYFKAKNSLSPVICGILVDCPNSIRILLGLM